MGRVSWVCGVLVWVVLVDAVPVDSVPVDSVPKFVAPVRVAPVRVAPVRVAPVQIAVSFVVVVVAQAHQPDVPYSAKRADLAAHTRTVLVAVGTVCYSAPPCLRYCLRYCLSLTPFW